MSGAWIDALACALVAAGLALRWLAFVQRAEKVGAALAGTARADVLAATCEASEAGWARLVRGALRAAPVEAEDAGYRSAPARPASPELVAARDAESVRLRRVVVVGMVAVATALASAVRIGFVAPVPAAPYGLVALVLGWRIVVSARRASRALATAFDALPAVVARVEPPPPPRRVNASVLPLRLSDKGCLGCLGLLFAMPGGVVVALLVGQAWMRVDAATTRTSLFALVFFAPLFAVGAMVLARPRIEVDGGDLVFITRVLGVAWSRTRIPLEIYRGVSTRPSSRGAQTLFVELASGASVRVYDGFDTKKITDALSALVG